MRTILKAFVTGATGFVGSHVARVLADQGADLRLLVRSTSNPKNIEGVRADRVVGDLRDAASLEKAMSGCDTVFHVAADYRLWARDGRSRQGYASLPPGTGSAEAVAWATLIAALDDVLARIKARRRDPGRFSLTVYSSSEPFCRQRARTAFGEWSTRQAWRLWASLETASPRTRIRPCPWTT